MHLFFENVALQIYAHWTGKFFSGELFNNDYDIKITMNGKVLAHKWKK